MIHRRGAETWRTPEESRAKRDYLVPGFALLSSLFSHRGFSLRLCASAVLLYLGVVNALAASKDGVVAAGSPYAAQVGAEVLERGGNAVDAAVATAFALTVTEPGMSGLGGRTVLLVGFPDGRVEGVNGGVAWPEKWIALRRSGAAYSKPKGWGQIAVPGTVAALAESHRKWGSLPLRELIRPSIRLARNGFVLTKGQEAWFARSAKAMSADPVLRSIYLRPDGSPVRAGELLRQPGLADALHLIAEEGPEVFYRGTISRAIVREMERSGGYVTSRDLERYAALPATPVRLPFGPYRIVSMDRPAMGRALLWCLDVFHRLPRKDFSPADRAHAQAEILSLMPALLNDRPLNGAYARLLTESGARRLTGENAAEMAEAILGHLRNRSTGIPRRAAQDREFQTTHLAVADRSGMLVSLTQTIGNFFGPKVALPGYGITFADTMGYLGDSDVSQSPYSSISPTMVFDERNQPLLAVGAAGGDRIPGAIFQILHHVLDRGMDLRSAVDAPRIAFESDPKGNRVYLEGGDQPEVRALIRELRKRGVPAAPLPKGESVARAHALMRSPDGEWIGAADPRWIGIAASPLDLKVEANHGEPQPLKREE